MAAGHAPPTLRMRCRPGAQGMQAVDFALGGAAEGSLIPPLAWQGELGGLRAHRCARGTAQHVGGCAAGLHRESMRAPQGRARRRCWENPPGPTIVQSTKCLTACGCPPAGPAPRRGSPTWAHTQACTQLAHHTNSTGGHAAAPVVLPVPQGEALPCARLGKALAQRTHRVTPLHLCPRAPKRKALAQRARTHALRG